MSPLGPSSVARVSYGELLLFIMGMNLRHLSVPGSWGFLSILESDVDLPSETFEVDNERWWSSTYRMMAYLQYYRTASYSRMSDLCGRFELTRRHGKTRYCQKVEISLSLEGLPVEMAMILQVLSRGIGRISCLKIRFLRFSFIHTVPDISAMVEVPKWVVGGGVP